PTMWCCGDWHIGPERGGGRGQCRRRALRDRYQEGEHRPGPLRQRCAREDPRRRHVAAALRGPAGGARPVARPSGAALRGLNMRVLTTDEIDRELESRTKEVATMSATLVELENHPGLEHV